MIVLYYKDAPMTDDCTLREVIPDVDKLIEANGKWYVEPLEPAIVNDASVFDWFVVPEQTIVYPEYCYQDVDEMELLVIMPKVGELNLIHFSEGEPEGFIPLSGTGVPDKVEHIEDFLTKMFPTRGI